MHFYLTCCKLDRWLLSTKVRLPKLFRFNFFIVSYCCSAASGSDSASGYLWNSDFVEDKEGNYNSASADANVDCYSYDTRGRCSVSAYTNTSAGDGSSHSDGGVSGTTGRKLL
jgi:hypothetical protein